MKYKIKGQKEKKVEVEKELTISLELDSCGSICVIGVDEDGFDWSILSLMPDGTFRRHTGLNTTGLRTNTNGRIKESKQ